MDATEYKTSIAAPEAMRRETLDASLQVLRAMDPAVSQRVEAALQVQTIPRPSKHAGGAEWVTVSLPVDLAESVVDCLGSAEAEAVGLDGNTTPEASRVAGLLDTWSRWLQAREA